MYTPKPQSLNPINPESLNTEPKLSTWRLLSLESAWHDLATGVVVAGLALCTLGVSMLRPTAQTLNQAFSQHCELPPRMPFACHGCVSGKSRTPLEVYAQSLPDHADATGQRKSCQDSLRRKFPPCSKTFAKRNDLCSGSKPPKPAEFCVASILASCGNDYLVLELLPRYEINNYQV